MANRERISELRAKLRCLLPELTSRYHVRSLGMFGSQAREDEHASSDVDLLVSFDETPGLLKFIELEHHLSDRLGMDVDLVMEDALKGEIRRGILEEIVPV